MNIINFIASMGGKRLFSAKTVTDKRDYLGAFASQMQKLTDLLPDGKVHVEVRGSQIAILIGWNGERVANPLKPISMDMVAGASMATIVNTPDGSPFYSVLQSDNAIVGEAPLHTTHSSLLTKENSSLVTKEASQQTMIRKMRDFVAKNFLLRFNLLTLQTECASKEDINEQGHHIYYNVDTRLINSMTEDAIEAGIECWNQDISRCVNSTKVKTYHPFHEYFNSLPEWDGVDRVTPLAQQLSSDPLIVKSFHRWMLALTAQWMGFGNPEYANSVAPLLISEKQGWGKSTFCRSLMPKELSRYFTDSYDLNANSAAEQKLTTFGLINLDEFDKLSSKKMATLKNLMQMPTTNIRRPYKQTYEQLPRIASFIGTSNRKDLLFDKTGSRRFICIELEKSLTPTLSSGEGVEQLYAQLKAELERGERYWFSKEEEAEIQVHNKKYYHTSPAEEIFSTMFRLPEGSGDDVLELSAANIYERMRKAHPRAMQSISSTAFARLMPTLATVEHTRYGNVYRVVEV